MFPRCFLNAERCCSSITLFAWYLSSFLCSARFFLRHADIRFALFFPSLPLPAIAVCVCACYPAPRRTLRGVWCLCGKYTTFAASVQMFGKKTAPALAGGLRLRNLITKNSSAVRGSNPLHSPACCSRVSKHAPPRGAGFRRCSPPLRGLPLPALAGWFSAKIAVSAIKLRRRSYNSKEELPFYAVSAPAVAFLWRGGIVVGLGARFAIVAHLWRF